MTASSGKDVADDKTLLYGQIFSAIETCEETISNKFKPSLLKDFLHFLNSSLEFEQFQDVELLQKWFQEGEKPENINEGFMFAIIKHFSPLGMRMQEVYGKSVAVFGTNPKDGATYHELSEISRQNEPVVLHLIQENTKQISESISNTGSDNIQYIAYPYFYKGKTASCFAFFVPTDKFYVKNGTEEKIEYLFIPIFLVEGKFHIGSIYCLDKNNRNAKIGLAKKRQARILKQFLEKIVETLGNYFS